MVESLEKTVSVGKWLVVCSVLKNALEIACNVIFKKYIIRMRSLDNTVLVLNYTNFSAHPQYIAVQQLEILNSHPSRSTNIFQPSLTCLLLLPAPTSSECLSQ